MKLSVNLLFSALKERCPQARLLRALKSDNEMVLPRPHFSSGPPVLRPNRIYVTAEEHLESAQAMEGHCLVITPRAEGYSGVGVRLSVITVAGEDVVSLYNSVQAVFDRYAQWNEMLQELVFGNAPMEDLLRCSFPIINNSMTVHNNEFAYLARIRDFAPEEDFIDPELLHRAQVQSGKPVFLSREVIAYRDGESGWEYRLLNLFHGNTVAGRLVVINDHHEFTPQDDALIRHFGRYLEAALTYAAFSGGEADLRRVALVDLLSGRQHSADKTQHLQAVSPWAQRTADQRMYCLVAACRDAGTAQRYAAYQLERALPDAVSVLFDSNIVVLCANRAGQSEDELFGQAAAVLERLSAVAGCSDPVEVLEDLIYYYRQAEFALHRLESREDGGVLEHFRPNAVEFFLRYGCSTLPERLMCAKCVRELARHDRTSAVSYCDSLRAYLDTGRNSAETARRLNIRRNTFLARLERILRYVDLDLEKEDDRLYLQLSLRLIGT